MMREKGKIFIVSQALQLAVQIDRKQAQNTRSDKTDPLSPPSLVFFHC